jgi:thymidylate synthase (FAD)
MEIHKGARVDVELIDHMGSDASVVNAARVSFGKRITEMSEGDTKLIRYLAKHNHWSPFGHASVQFRIKAPIFVARQLVKHQVGLTWNEISRRYVDYEPEFYEVDKWRGRPVDKKQGSSEENIEWINRSIRTSALQDQVENVALANYNLMIGAGVAPEQARMILPQSMMTEWYWSGTLYAFARVCNLRCAEDAQYETRIVANLINDECEKLFPISWTELRNT